MSRRLAAYYRGAHVIVAVFDMSDVDTLKSAERWVNEALQTVANDQPLIYLVGSKCDLVVSSASSSATIGVSLRVDRRSNLCKSRTNRSGDRQAAQRGVLVAVLAHRSVAEAHERERHRCVHPRRASARVLQARGLRRVPDVGQTADELAKHIYGEVHSENATRRQPDAKHE